MGKWYSGNGLDDDCTRSSSDSLESLYWRCVFILQSVTNDKPIIFRHSRQMSLPQLLKTQSHASIRAPRLLAVLHFLWHKKAHKIYLTEAEEKNLSQNRRWNQRGGAKMLESANEKSFFGSLKYVRYSSASSRNRYANFRKSRSEFLTSRDLF